jgi:hypothetical protein
MPLELQNVVIDQVLRSTRAAIHQTPSWLIRPGISECGSEWALICRIYNSLTGLTLPEAMRAIERRTVDLVFQIDGARPRILEVDERQHFNEFRLTTLKQYPPGVPVAFDIGEWERACRAKTKLEGGGFAAPKPPLFPGEGGRHRQRAFRDALCDLLPPLHGYLPTLRIAEFEVRDWIFTPTAPARMDQLLRQRL